MARLQRLSTKTFAQFSRPANRSDESVSAMFKAECDTVLNLASASQRTIRSDEEKWTTSSRWEFFSTAFRRSFAKSYSTRCRDSKRTDDRVLVQK